MWYTATTQAFSTLPLLARLRMSLTRGTSSSHVVRLYAAMHLTSMGSSEAYDTSREGKGRHKGRWGEGRSNVKGASEAHDVPS
eukprot:scaffold222663_cov27-Tisochrysis_lutea.AAC.1